MTYSTQLFSIGCVALLAPLGVAQRGVLTGVPSAYVFDGATPGFAVSEFHKTSAAVPNTISQNPVSVVAPDFDLVSMFGVDACNVKLDAISTGNDMAPVNPNGEIVPVNQWALTTVSVSNQSIGQPGSILRGLVNDPAVPSVGSEILGFYPEGSILPQSLLGQATLEQSITDNANPASLAGLETVAFDAFIPVIEFVAGTGQPMFPVTTQFYFSVTHASAAALGWTDALGNPTDGATVFNIWWNGSTGMWSAPTVVATAADLHCFHGEEVDALGITDDGVGPIIMFSTQQFPGSTRPQLEVLIAGGVLPLKRQNGQTVTDGIGLLPTDDVTGYCAIDPDFFVVSRGIGSPLASFFDGPRLMSASSCQTHAATGGGDILHVMIGGWGTVTPQPGSLQLYAALPDGSYLMYSTVARTATQNVVSQGIPIPAVAAGIGYPIGFIGLFLPTTPGGFAISPETWIAF